MAIEFRAGPPPPGEGLWKLFTGTGWNLEYRLSQAELVTAAGRSWLVCCAYDADRLVGFGRVVSDGILHAMIYELITDPGYRGRGIGTGVLERLVAGCREAGIRDIQLFSAKGKTGFYEKRGFSARPPDAAGMEYLPGLQPGERIERSSP
jgi:ribosomal protein S18 acetylase RimI-like enzyme